MSTSSNHYFWQEMIDKEHNARTKYSTIINNAYRFFENNYLKTKSPGTSIGWNRAHNIKWNLSELRKSDHSMIKPSQIPDDSY